MSLKIIVEEREISFLEQEDKNILNALDRNNIESHYHCRDGFCGACRCKLISGEVKYAVEPLAFVAEDEILTCCAQPITDIKIEVD